MNRSILIAGALWGIIGVARADEPVLTELPATVVVAERIAHPVPVVGFASPVSLLVFEPRVDVQSRGFAEAQADVSVRGGTFEQTGFLLGPLTLLDPQTGHYFAEIPFSPRILGSPEILTGGNNSLEAFNSTAGSVAYRFAPVLDGGIAAFGAGDNGLLKGEVFTGINRETEWGTLGVNAEASDSQSDGTIPNGDHEIQRVSGRVRLANDQGVTDFAAGYQDKFFGWPNLYAAPFDSPEAEDIQTTTVLLNHRHYEVADGPLEFGAYYRRNDDDYDFNRFRPGVGNPFVHTTQAYGMALAADPEAGGIRWRSRVAFYGDDIESTSLTETFQSRSYARLAMVPEWTLPGATPFDEWTLRGGGTYSDSNRDTAAFDGVLGVDWSRVKADRRLVLGAGYSGASQVPGYTAIGSSPQSGLFRGNPDLGREQSDQFEVALALTGTTSHASATVFHRRDRDLVDWTYTAALPTSRTANPIDTDTTGVELLYQRQLWAGGRGTVSYSYLHKDESYRTGVDASFYALNYPEHRATLAWIQPLAEGLEARADLEFRQQRENFLRTTGEDAYLGYLSLAWNPRFAEALTLTAAVDNVFDENFEEVPGTPAGRRQWILSARVVW